MFEEDKDGFSLTKTMDAKPILEINKKEYNNWSTKSDHSSDGLRKVASIPVTVWENWCKETNGEIKKDQKLLYKYLNNSDNKYFRTNPTEL
jgi:hypothetical protein